MRGEEREVTKDAHKTGRRSPLLLGGAAVAVVVVLALALGAAFTIPVTLDGRHIRVLAGTTVASLFDTGRVKAVPGDLLSARTRRVLRAGGGQAAFVLVNGLEVGRSRKLKASDVIQSRNGADMVERVLTKTEKIKSSVTYLGTGPFETVVVAARTGERELRIGSISHEVESVRVVREPVDGLVRRSTPVGGMVIALTFDDGPWPAQTQAILAILQKFKIKATFFEVGSQARDRPALSHMLTDAGMQIGNHTESHPNLRKLNASGVAEQIRTAQVNITKASGQAPRYFRPPGGETTPAMWATMKKLGLQLVMWTVDPRDWSRPGAAAIEKRVLAGARPGGVVLMHDGGGDRSQTIAALPRVIAGLLKKHYRFVTLDQLIRLPQKMG